jgi:hypothetical protein
MRKIFTPLKLPALVLTAVTFSAVVTSAPASAQTERCVDLYGRVMAFYHADPYSPEYARISTHYSRRCLGPPSAAAYPGQYPAQYPQYQYAAPTFQGTVILDDGRVGDAGDGGEYRWNESRRPR